MKKNRGPHCESIILAICSFLLDRNSNKACVNLMLSDNLSYIGGETTEFSRLSGTAGLTLKVTEELRVF
jgi:hypothetical protein